MKRSICIIFCVAFLACHFGFAEGQNDKVQCPSRSESDFKCRSGDRKGRRFLGPIGFLTGLHLGGAISSTGSLSASHSLNVFGKVMNTALSVSYGPNGLYQGAAAFPIPVGVGAPLPPARPPFGLQDESTNGSQHTLSSTDKGQEAMGILNIRRKSSVTKVVVDNAKKQINVTDSHEQSDHTVNRNGSLPGDEQTSSLTPQKVKVVVEGAGGGLVSIDNAPSSTFESSTNQSSKEDEEVIGEEPDPPKPSDNLIDLSARRQSQAEVQGRVRVSGPAALQQHHKLFLKRHNEHIARLNKKFAHYKADISRVAGYSRS